MTKDNAVSWMGSGHQVKTKEMKDSQYLTYDSATYDFLTLHWCESNMPSVEAILQILNFDFFPRLVIRSTILSHGAG